MRYRGCNSDGELMSSMVVHQSDDERIASSYTNHDPSMTRQEFADDADINVLMARFEATGLAPTNLNKGEPRYLDVSNVPDMQTALETLNEATSAFMSLSATVRRKFDNDPVKFVEFAQDPKNKKDLQEWGLAAPDPVEPPPAKVELVNPPEAKPKDEKRS